MIIISENWNIANAAVITIIGHFFLKVYNFTLSATFAILLIF